MLAGVLNRWVISSFSSGNGVDGGGDTKSGIDPRVTDARDCSGSQSWAASFLFTLDIHGRKIE
jgi:hypothetical protein